MEEISYLVKSLLANKSNRALEVTNDLMRIAEELYVEEFMETYSIVYSEEYEQKRQELEEIQQKLSSVRKSLGKLKKEIPIY